MPFSDTRIVCMFLIMYFLICCHKSETKFCVVAELLSLYGIRNMFYTVFIIVNILCCGKYHVLLYNVSFFL